MDTDEKKTCFVVMPISDVADYDAGHFARVYEHLIKPACVEAGFDTVRADDVKNTNFIILDILKRIVEADVVVCDLSSRNPNVLYELGIRQAFDLPVVLIKDSQTDRIFDIQGVRTNDYDESLRVDTVKRDRQRLISSIHATVQDHEADPSSLIRLLSVRKAELPQSTELSQGSSLILDAISDIAERISAIESRASVRMHTKSSNQSGLSGIPLQSGEFVEQGEQIYDRGDLLGKLVNANERGLLIEDENEQMILIRYKDPIMSRLTTLPF